ncbi:hypothetical protein [Microbacterium arborescens]|uniref:hypothetical protein n=1 Tax=Microbacterium arborescens TaxID=33883 RepID=UPI0027840DBB|nr:hypothetical protein [Microbacterium arborescens]MDQ1217840.1 putative nucleic acid-binding Zn-ribbon protein [Microbacterium arborescens]
MAAVRAAPRTGIVTGMTSPQLLVPDATRLDAASVRTLEMIAALRPRLTALRDEVDAVRRRAAELERDTAWRARAARDYRERLAAWRERSDNAAMRIDRLDDELRRVQARLVTGGR